MWNAEKWSYKDGMEAFYVILLLLAREPKTQIAGVTLIADFTGMTRKHIATDLEDIKAWVRDSTMVCQWRSTGEMLEWFRSLKEKKKLSFVQYDIEAFYPSITKDLLMKSIN